MKLATAKRLLDAKRSCERIERLTSSTTLEVVLQDEDKQAALERYFEVLGEAVNIVSKVDPTLAECVPHLRDAVGMRNRLIDAYDSVDHEIVWLTALERIPPLRAVLSDLLKDPLDDA